MPGYKDRNTQQTFHSRERKLIPVFLFTFSAHQFSKDQQGVSNKIIEPLIYIRFKS